MPEQVPVVTTDNWEDRKVLHQLQTPIVAYMTGNDFQSVKDSAIKRLTEQATMEGANAVVGFGLTLAETVRGGQTVYSVAVYGTAVQVDMEDGGLRDIFSRREPSDL